MGCGNLEGAASNAAQLPEFSLDEALSNPDLIKDVPAYPSEV